jgi:hypothetical protein
MLSCFEMTISSGDELARESGAGAIQLETSWNTALWRQFGAAIEMLEHAVTACPTPLWTRCLWRVPSSSGYPPRFAEFWYVSYHTLVWLDLYVAGVPEQEFAPPAPFPQGEIDSIETLPERPYTKEELLAYLASLRQTCHTRLAALTDEEARRSVEYPWIRAEPITYLELQLYNMRHVQEHAAQLSLFLGQHAVPDAEYRWVPQATADPGDR